MSSNTATGVISHLSETQQVTEKLSKRLVVLTIGDKYPEQVAFEFVNDKIDLTDQLAEGETVTVHYNLRGREWNGKYFVSLAGWKVEGAATTAAAPAQKAAPVAAQVEDESGSDLPF